MTRLDTSEMISQLRVIESIALMSHASSTNLLARRVLEECIANGLALPSALIIARQQTAGRGRGNRTWDSPPDAGIYATVLHSRPADRLATLPLEIAVIVAGFLRHTYGLDARIKWPNDILVAGKKIAGILIEARTHNGRAYTAIGTGINVAPVSAELAPTATSISEHSTAAVDLDDATAAFVRWLDRGLAGSGKDPVEEWRRLSIHHPGDPVTLRLGERELRGTWEDIDSSGRALIREGAVLREVSAADLV